MFWRLYARLSTDDIFPLSTQQCLLWSLVPAKYIRFHQALSYCFFFKILRIDDFQSTSAQLLSLLNTDDLVWKQLFTGIDRVAILRDCLHSYKISAMESF